MGKWPVGQWIVDAMRFQKIFGLYSVERHEVEKWSAGVGSGQGDLKCEVGSYRKHAIFFGSQRI